MSDINIEGNVVEDIFMQALNCMPQGASAIAQMIASKRRRKPLNNQQLFKKTVKAMNNMNVGKEEDILKYATRAYLQKHFGLPACDTSAYDVKVRKGRITLKFNPNSPGSVPFGFWMNKHGLENKTITDPSEARTYTKLTPEEITTRLNENSNWIEQKNIYKQRIAEMFNANSEQIGEIFKDNVPERADFSNCEITGFDFSKYDLSGANFKGAKLVNCTVSKMEHADLSEAVLAGCIFTSANLAASDFNKAVISNTTFDKADLRDCNFSQAEPHDVTFREAALKSTNLDFVQPQNIVFESEGSMSKAKENTRARKTSKTQLAARASTRTARQHSNPEKRKANKQQELQPDSPKPESAHLEAAATKAKKPATHTQTVEQSINM